MANIWVRLLVLLLFIGIDGIRAQNFDFATIEAYIHDHKQIKSALLARQTIEQANEVLHQHSMEEVIDYKEINKKLDKYTKCFDYIDLIYNAGRTAFNVYNSYDDIKDVMGDLGRLNQDFIDKCLLRGDIKPADSIVIRTYVNMISAVSRDAEQLIVSLTGLVVTLAPPHSCTTSILMAILNDINNCLDHIVLTIRKGYYTLWKYITIRTHYWKNSLYSHYRKSRLRICNEAFERWVDSRAATLNQSFKDRHKDNSGLSL